MKCVREGCPSIAPEGHSFCTRVCYEMHAELKQVERIGRKYPDQVAVTERWVTLVEAVDAWSTYRATVKDLR